MKRKMNLKFTSKISFILGGCLLFLLSATQAQNLSIKGKVVDENNIPISDISITAKGLSQTVTTDSLGQFELTGLEKKDYSVTLSGIGYGTTEKTMAAGSSNVTVSVKSKYNQLMEVEVFGTRTKHGYWVDSASLGTLGKISWQKNPFSIYTVTEERIRNLQASNLTDVLKAQPSVQSQTGGSRVTDYFTSRGFSSSVWTNNTSVEGLISHNPVEPIEDKARVEVMNGPNSLLYGITSPGGMVNSYLKRPTDTLLARVTVGDYGGQQGYVHADVGGPISKKLAYRANVVYVDKGNTNVKSQTHQRYLASAAFDWKVLPNLKWSFDGSVFHRDAEHTQSIYMIGSATKAPDAPDASKNYGSTAGFAKDDYWRVGTDVNWGIMKSLKFKANFRYTQFSRQYVLLRRNLANDSMFTVRADYQGKNRNLNPQGSALFSYDLKTGLVKQNITMGYIADYLRTEVPSTKNYTKTYTAKTKYDLSAAYPEIPLFDTLVASGSPYAKSVVTNTNTGVIVDNVNVGKMWNVLLGLTYSSISNLNWNALTGAETSSYNKAALSPSAAILYTPIKPLTFYASYIQALQAGSIVTTDANCLNSGEALAPYRSYQTEVGIKASLGQIHLQLAGFRIEQANSYNDSIGGGSSKYTVTEDGKEVHTGLEFTAQGIVMNSLSICFGATLLDPKITKTSTAYLKDKSPQGVAKQMGKLSLEYAIPFIPRLFVNGTLNYTGKEWVDVKNTISIPEVWTEDLGLRYKLPVKRHVVGLRATVTNVAGVNYWTTRSGILYLGDPRTFAFSADFTW